MEDQTYTKIPFGNRRLLAAEPKNAVEGTPWSNLRFQFDAECATEWLGYGFGVSFGPLAESRTDGDSDPFRYLRRDDS